jgi:hypothetical protein
MKSEKEIRKIFEICLGNGDCSLCPLFKEDNCISGYFEALKWVLEDDNIDNIDITEVPKN